MSTLQIPPTSCRELPQRDKEALVWPFDSLVDVEDGDGSLTKTLKIAICFIGEGGGAGGTPWARKKLAVLNSIKKDRAELHERKTWEHFANIRFDVVDDPQAALIRVGFDQRERQRSWSYIGQEAEKHKPDITLNLGDLDSEAHPSLGDFGTILHEFGHALGLAHEHQSPLRTENSSRLIRKYYGDTGKSIGSEKLLKEQIYDVLDGKKVSNLTRFDPKSIMMYHVQGITEKANTELSELDQAFITLTYPPDLTDHDNDATKERLSRFKQAIKILGLETKAGEIMGAFLNPGPVLKMSLETPEVSDRLRAVRKRFAESNGQMSLLHPNMNVVASSTKQYSLLDPRSTRPSGLTDPALTRRYGLLDPLGDVARNKLFQSIMKRAVKNAVEQRGVPVMQWMPEPSPTEITGMMGAICLHEEIARYVKAYKNDFQGSEPVIEGHTNE